jgi:quercetin dioxygenase-like cupin family protein
VIALAPGRLLTEHDNTGDATVHVLHGRVCMHSGGDRCEHPYLGL